MIEQAPETDAVPRPLRIAVLLIGLECLALVGAAGVLVVKTITGKPSDALGAVLAALIASGVAAGLGYAARALHRLQPWARSPVIVMQLLALPVSYSLAFQAGRIGYGGPIMAVALATLLLLFTPPVREALERG